MEYTRELAEPYLGKRVLVSLRERGADGTDTFTGFWGIIGSAQQHGLVVDVEGGDIEGFWIMPPDLSALEPAAPEAYHFRDRATPVTQVDYIANFVVAESPEQLGIDPLRG